MAKREFPLFIFDSNRAHGLGECDFVACTDIDNGFIAEIDFVENCPEEYSGMVMTGEERNGIRLRLKIKRIFGKNTEESARKTLMRKAMNLYTERQTVSINTFKPTTEDCIDFLNELIRGNMHNIAECGSDYNQRQIVLTSIAMLQSCRDKLRGTL